MLFVFIYFLNNKIIANRGTSEWSQEESLFTPATRGYYISREKNPRNAKERKVRIRFCCETHNGIAEFEQKYCHEVSFYIIITL